MKFRIWMESTGWKEEIESVQGMPAVMAVLQRAGVEVFTPRLLTPVLVVTDGGELFVIDDPDFPEAKEANEWLMEVINYGRLDTYLQPYDFNADFWRQVRPGSRLYHGTTSENVENITSRGLEPRCKTRGISNRSVACAIFASSDMGVSQAHYGNEIIVIDVGGMKQSGFMPVVSQEPAVEQAQQEESLARAIGLDEFQAEYDSDMDPGTVIFYDPIPPKFLSLAPK